MGLPVYTYAGTGLASVINEDKEGPTLLLLTDIDALEGEEETGLPFASVHPGKMHACGHDGHMASLLTAAKILQEHRDEIPGKVLLVFEPNEEHGNGAMPMIKDGILDDHPVDGCFGLHVWPAVQLGQVAVTQGAVMAGTIHFRIRITGRAGHTGSPHLAADPIICSAAVLQNLQTIQTREINIQKPTLIMVGKIEGGVLPNVIPEYVDMLGTCRHLYEMTEEEDLRSRMERVVESTAAAYGMTGEIEWRENFPAVVNDDHMVDIAARTVEKVIGEGRVTSFRATAGDDFSEFAKFVPGVFVHVGTGHQDGTEDYSLHHPRFTIDEESIKYMTAMYVGFTLDWFEDQAGKE
jgi:amidohydrolase